MNPKGQLYEWACESLPLHTWALIQETLPAFFICFDRGKSCTVCRVKYYLEQDLDALLCN